MWGKQSDMRNLRDNVSRLEDEFEEPILRAQVWPFPEMLSYVNFISHKLGFGKRLIILHRIKGIDMCPCPATPNRRYRNPNLVDDILLMKGCGRGHIVLDS